MRTILQVTVLLALALMMHRPRTFFFNVAVKCSVPALPPVVTLPTITRLPMCPVLSGDRRDLGWFLGTLIPAGAGAGAPAIWPVQVALQAYSGEIAALRSEGLTRGLPGDVAERFFAIGFSLEQMRQNLKDLERCVAEWTEAVPDLPNKEELGS